MKTRRKIRNNEPHSGKKHKLRLVLNGLASKENKFCAKKAKTAAAGTQDNRMHILEPSLFYVLEKGFDISNVKKSFKNKHMQIIVDYWVEKGNSPATVMNKLSVFRTFARWIGKEGMIRSIHFYVDNPEAYVRSVATKVDKSWEAAGIDIEQKIEEVRGIDSQVAIQLELSATFALRVKEAFCIRFSESDKGDQLLITRGAKNGRSRVIPVETQAERALIEKAKKYANKTTGSLIPAEKSLKQWKGRFYRVCKKAGITRENGFTAHGLRHQVFNDLYKKLTGSESPVRARSAGRPIPKVAKDVEDPARYEITNRAGHGRKQISGAYIGSGSPQARNEYESIPREKEKDLINLQV